MYRAKVFLTVCAGVFLLALSYHLGARTATAQAPGNPVVGFSAFGGGMIVAATANGDVYYNGGSVNTPFQRDAYNIFGGGPTPARPETFGSLKSRYRGERGAVRPAPQDR